MTHFRLDKMFFFLPLYFNATISHEKILICTINKDALQIGPGFIYTKLIFRSLNLSLWPLYFSPIHIEKIDRNRQPENCCQKEDFGPRGHLTDYLPTLRGQSWTFY